MDDRRAGQPPRAQPRLADELVRRRVDVILANGAPQSWRRALPEQHSERHGVGVDPISLGIVSNCAHPDGDVTGATSVGYELRANRLELLREVVPSLSRVAYLFNAATRATSTRSTIRLVQRKVWALHSCRVDVRSPDANVMDAMQAAQPGGRTDF